MNSTYLLDIIIPTYSNPQFLNPCVASIVNTGILDWAGRLIIVNNGAQDCAQDFARLKNCIVVEGKKDANGMRPNLGWEGGLKLGLEYSDAPYVVFQNDDTHIPVSSFNFYQRLMANFDNENVGAVGPTSTVVMGPQCVFQPGTPRTRMNVKFLVFFCVMLSRKWLDAVGGIDTELPGGDDLDMSMRLRKMGKQLILDPGAFIIHHGFKTGERVKGTDWNSIAMTERTREFLIRKHGLREYLITMSGAMDPINDSELNPDSEGDIIRSFVKDQSAVELGCGSSKTVDNSIGVDVVPHGHWIPQLGKRSVADVIADVSERLPFEDQSKDILIARHILEHCLDTLETLKQWNRVLKMGGRLIVAVPDEERHSSIPLNPEHVHGFSRKSLKHLVECSGFQELETHDPKNGVSFVGVYQKVRHFTDAELEVVRENGKPLEVLL